MRDATLGAWSRAARALGAVVLAATVSACSYAEDVYAWLDEKETASGPEARQAAAAARESGAERLYEEALKALEDGNERTAAEKFDEVERLYPTSRFAKMAVLKSAEASYKGGEFDKAVLSARRFLDFYPSDPQASEAQHLIAMSHYDRITDVGRDQGRTREAAQALRELINRYPDSRHVPEAKLKLDLTYDHLAGKEMTVGRFYLRRGEYVGAINRFRTVVEQYQQTSHVEEALHRLVESYLSLGVVTEAQTAAAVLGHNFPGSQWYRDSYVLLTDANLEPSEDDASWISRAWSSMTGRDIF